MFRTFGLQTFIILTSTLAGLTFGSACANAQDEISKQAAQGAQGNQQDREEPAADYTPFEWRVWTDATGKTTYGQFDRIVDKADVIIVDGTGEQITIPIHDLTAPDIFEAFQNSFAYDPQVQKEEAAIINAATDSSFAEQLTEEPMVDPDEPGEEQNHFMLGDEDSDRKFREQKLDELLAEIEKLDAPAQIREEMFEEIRMRKEAMAAEAAAEAAAKNEARAKRAALAKEAATAKDTANSELEEFKAAQQARFALQRQWDQARTWTDVSGQRTIEGKFQRIVDRSKVVLLKSDGEEQAISLADLSADDIYVAVYGERARPDGTRRRGIIFSSEWIPGENKN